MAVAGSPDLVAIHKELADLQLAAEELARSIGHTLERVEDVLDAQESRESLKRPRVPWGKVKADLELG